jgi:hypothetical protein
MPSIPNSPLPTPPPPAGIGHNAGPPLLADDLLHGAGPIAVFLFGTAKAVRTVYRLSTEVKPELRPPFFRIGSVLCARKSTLLRWIAEQEEEAARQRA